MVGQQLTAIAITAPVTARLHLHPQKVLPMFDSHIVGPRFSPGLAHREPPPRRLRHKLQLHPLATLLIGPEPFPRLHPQSSQSPICRNNPEPRKTKGATRRPHLIQTPSFKTVAGTLGTEKAAQ